jgi:capsular polysaccharide biosynthesis protein
MYLSEFLYLISNKKMTILSVAVLFLLIGAIVTVIQPLKYQAHSEVLVVQDFNAGIDNYAAARSNEYLSNLLTKVIPSSSFFQSVIRSDSNIDPSYFTFDDNEKTKNWQKSVKAQAIFETGIIKIDVYHSNSDQALLISTAVNNVLRSRNGEYQSSGKNATIKMIQEPIVSNWPVKPNIPVNLAVSFFLGIIMSLIYIYIFPGWEYDLWLWHHDKRPHVNNNSRTIKERYESERDSGPFRADQPNPRRPVSRENLLDRVIAPLEKKIEPEPRIEGKSPKELSLEDIINRGNVKNIIDK